MTDTTVFGWIQYDLPAPGIAWISPTRADKHNAQDLQMLYNINGAYARVVRDQAIKAIVLDADEINFSSGHNVTEVVGVSDLNAVTLSECLAEPGGHGRMTIEGIYLGMHWRWRDLLKPRIAEVEEKSDRGWANAHLAVLHRRSERRKDVCRPRRGMRAQWPRILHPCLRAETQHGA